MASAENQKGGERQAIRPQYERLGVEGYYRRYGQDYRNPHEAQIHELLERLSPQLELSQVLDLACGSGEVSVKLLEWGAQVSGVDPYTAQAYARRTGQVAEAFSFEDIAAGALAGRDYSLIVCSFALHLLEPSRLPLVCAQLAQLAPALLILSPHKRPVLRPAWGWTLVFSDEYARVKARLYRRSG